MSGNVRKLTIECGERSLSRFGSGDAPDLVHQIFHLREIAEEHHVELDVIVYSGLVSPLSGGRPTDRDLESLERLVDCVNPEELPVCVAMNGGLHLDLESGRRLLHQLDPILSLLDQTGQRWGVTNHVCIMHPALFEHARENYPRLGKIASCIQVFYPFRRHDYAESLREYDHVVPLNQHTTPAFLERYREHCRKLIVFLTLGCGTPDFRKCFRHYTEIESEYPSGGKPNSEFDPSPLPSIPCQLSEEYRHCDDGALIDRDDDLIGLIRLGIDKFKVPRNGVLSEERFLKLIRIFTEHAVSETKTVNPSRTY